jgi:hypothetical protein
MLGPQERNQSTNTSTMMNDLVQNVKKSPVLENDYIISIKHQSLNSVEEI